MQNALTEQERDLLTDAVVVGGWHIEASNIIAAAGLMVRGFLTAEDDYEGPRLRATKLGIRHAERARWAERDVADGGWAYTNAEGPRKSRRKAA